MDSRGWYGLGRYLPSVYLNSAGRHPALHLRYCCTALEVLHSSVGFSIGHLEFRRYMFAHPFTLSSSNIKIVFASVVTAILVLDYWVIRKKAWKIPDLYKGGPEYIYWYWHGINLRAWSVYIITVIPSLPGLVLSIMGKTDSNAVKIYQITYLFGVSLGSILYFAINRIFPPGGLGVDEGFDGMEVVEGVEVADDSGRGSGSSTPAKGPVLSEERIDGVF